MVLATLFQHCFDVNIIILDSFSKNVMPTDIIAFSGIGQELEPRVSRAGAYSRAQENKTKMTKNIIWIQRF